MQTKKDWRKEWRKWRTRFPMSCVCMYVCMYVSLFICKLVCGLRASGKSATLPCIAHWIRERCPGFVETFLECRVCGTFLHGNVLHMLFHLSHPYPGPFLDGGVTQLDGRRWSDCLAIPLLPLVIFQRWLFCWQPQLLERGFQNLFESSLHFSPRSQSRTSGRALLSLCGIRSA